MYETLAVAILANAKSTAVPACEICGQIYLEDRDHEKGKDKDRDKHR
jgi:hypothetical protein